MSKERDTMAVSRVGPYCSVLAIPLDVWGFDQDYSALFVDDCDDYEPVSDWKETSDAHILRADLPGVKKEDIHIEVKNYRVLTISGGGIREGTINTGKQQTIQCTQGHFFSKQVPLPDNVKPKEMIAKVENGVLTIKVPKSLNQKPNTRRLAITN